MNRVGQVEEGAPPLVKLLHRHVVDGGVRQIQHVHARVLAQTAVHESRQQEEERQYEQDHRHPLVVFDHALRLVGETGRLLLERHVVRVADPAVDVYVVLITRQYGWYLIFRN